MNKLTTPRFSQPAKPGSLTSVAFAISLALGGFSATAYAMPAGSASVPTSSWSAIFDQSRMSLVDGPDSDGDGIRNQDDLDDDNDGILDSAEGLIDSDGDGFADGSSVDTDSDGTPDALDLDSDNDGILDNIEARLDTVAARALDQVTNGAIDIGIAVGANGIADVIETFVDSGELAFGLQDSDADGTPDFRDLDSDNDAIFDLVEAGGVDNDSDGRIDGFNDTDGKGVADSVQSASLPLFDTDGDAILDFRDLDSDNDTLSDTIEGGGNRSFPTDTDGDGAPDFRENDSDGDGISDRVEAGANPGAPVDTDGDGTPDFQDADSNPSSGSGNGAPSAPPTDLPSDGSRPDVDGDGIANQDDLDDDNDGILDTEEGIIDADGNGVADSNSRDTDGDGTPDGNDLDSDNDGILDFYEARFNAATIAALDVVQNGAIDIQVPVGANGLADSIETSVDSGSLSTALFDTDGDGIFDYLDLDSDNDGISDLVEAGGSDSNADGRIDNFVDQDNKGVDDVVQASALPIFDTDGDGIRDFQDLDSDGDGLPDSVETTGNLATPPDTDGDGAADYREQDADGDGVLDSIEAGSDINNPADSNNNGIPDFQEGSFQGSGAGGGADVPVDGNPDDNGPVDNGPVDNGPVDNGPVDDDPRPDRDADGIANQDDLDDDNDGILDSEEGIIDADGNGVADANSRDTDGDGTPDGNDLDSDNDGILDLVEGRLDAQTIAALDPVRIGAIDIREPVGANGIADVIETSPDSGSISTNLRDTDGDGIFDYLDIDSDGDGIGDLVEAGGSDADSDGRIDNFIDQDDKGVADSVQASALPLFDTDGDGTLDFRDLDSDNDGLPDRVETRGPLGLPTDSDGDGAADYRELDSDNDGIDDATEAGPDANSPVDTNGDGIPDFQEPLGGAAPVVPDAGADGDGDGQANGVDLDDDNDGIADLVEGNADSDSDGIPDSLDLDSDNDGILDSLEGNGDADNDGVANFRDLDSDNDGLYDALEGSRGAISATGRLSAGSVDNMGLVAGASAQIVDTDGDAVPDWLDLDSDNDGLTDVSESLGADQNLDGMLDSTADANSDGADDSLANRALQADDRDSDRIPNYRDLDSDQDGIADIVENFSAGADLDGDGRIDNFVDSNSDGYDDSFAAATRALVDSDRDGLPNSLDLDSDNDGINDLVEAGFTDTDDNGQVDVLVDSDGDGISDVNDADITGGNDSDGDSIDDAVDSDFASDTDSDGDGVVDGGDPDSDGNGFAGPLADGVGQGTPIVLPDTDSDGVPDIVQAGSSRAGEIETGLDGSGFGCSIMPVLSSSTDARFDPSLGLLLGSSALLLAMRRFRIRVSKVDV